MSVTLISFICSNKIIKLLPKNGVVGFGRRKKSFNSSNWLKRREIDPYIELAKKENYRCRSAFKLIEICDKYDLVKPGFKVLDVGAAPGSWSQVLANKTNSNHKDPSSPVGLVLAIDLNTIYPINGVRILPQCDFTKESSQKKILEMLGPNEKFDFIFSDIAPPATGINELDRERLMNLIYPLLLFSVKNLKLGGGCLFKLWNGAENNFIKHEIINFFNNYKFIKPKASYQSSSEIYMLLNNFLGLKT